jgi:4-amino-4-deoxy-L-arabinose transferase-like glycosyltransferase
MSQPSSLSPSQTPLRRVLAWISARDRWLMAALALLYLIIGIATLRFYGLTWDEGLGNVFFGERYFYYLTTFKGKFLDFGADLSLLRHLPLRTSLAPFRAYPYEFPALIDTLSAAGMHLFAYRLNWLDAVDAWHLFTVALSAVFLWLLYAFAAPSLGKFAAFAGVLLLAVFPRFWADLHFNVKDIPTTIFMSLTILAYWRWYEKPGWRRALGVGLLFGAALAVKANAVFLPVLLALGVLPLNLKESWQHLRAAWGQYALMAVSGAGLYFSSWPYLYADPLRVREYFSYIASQGGRSMDAMWNWQPWKMTAAVLPETLLALLLVGLVLAVVQTARGKAPLQRLLLVWCLFPIVRISLPGMANFDGVRHFLEFLPAACLLAGCAAQALLDWIGKHKPAFKTAAGVMIVGLIVTKTAAITLNYGAYQHIYFNSLYGGLTGAAHKFGETETTDYWGATYRPGMLWLSRHAEAEAVVYAPVGDWLVQMTAPLYLREDMQVLGKQDAALLEKMDRPVYVMFITRPGFYDDVARNCVQNRNPLYEISVQGVPLLQIYKLTGASMEDSAWLQP